MQTEPRMRLRRKLNFLFSNTSIPSWSGSTLDRPCVCRGLQVFKSFCWRCVRRGSSMSAGSTSHAVNRNNGVSARMLERRAACKVSSVRIVCLCTIARISWSTKGGSKNRRSQTKGPLLALSRCVSGYWCCSTRASTLAT